VAGRDHKIVRAQQRAKNKVGAGDEQPTPEEQLVRLEENIRRLKVEFDIYFNGAAKRPPYDTKNRVETIIKRLGDDRTLSYAQRYHFNSLASRYIAFRDLWRRTLQGREEGRDPAAAARSLAVQGLGEPFSPSSFVSSDIRRDIATVKDLYKALVQAKRSCGETTIGFSLPRFHQLIASRADSLKEKLGCERVLFSVNVEEGHVSFKAKADE
jgi:hypothetical protein